MTPAPDQVLVLEAGGERYAVELTSIERVQGARRRGDRATDRCGAPGGAGGAGHRVSAHEQSVGMDQIAAAMSEVREASTSYAEGSAALQQSASDLDAVATALRELASRYRVEA